MFGRNAPPIPSSLTPAPHHYDYFPDNFMCTLSLYF